MSFLDNLQTKYKTLRSSLGIDFIKRVLSEFTLYRRETRWFCSSALRIWASSVIDVLENDDEGVDIRDQYSKSLDDLDKDFFNSLDYAITPCAEEVCPVMPSPASRLYWMNKTF